MAHSAFPQRTYATQVALNMLKTDKKMREEKVGALFKKLHERLQLRDIQVSVFRLCYTMLTFFRTNSKE